MKIRINNGRILNPATQMDGMADILVEDNIIVNISSTMEDVPVDKVIDATNCYVMPGLIDLHVHLRDPGLTYKETLETGTKAAAKGGFTTIVAMANTNPIIDNGEKLKSVLEAARISSPIQVLQVGSVTKNLEGKDLTSAKELKKAGAIALSEDGKTVMDAMLFRQALQQAKEQNLIVLAHCEDEQMKGLGVIHDGETAKKLNLNGISNAVEDVIIARDILLAKEVGAKLHICHCTTADGVKMIALAKKNNLPITAEVCPHHFTLTDKDITPGDSNYKMAPPLRSKKDVKAMIQGLQDGSIDVIATDHAPHAAHEKTEDLVKAAFGIVGLETAVSLVITELVRPGLLTPLQMAEKMSYNPAQIIGLPKGDLQIGKGADITIIDPHVEYTIDKETFVSMGRNTPFHGRKVFGQIKATIFQGKIVYQS